MDILEKNESTAKNIFRISISFVIATITANIVFIIFWSITFILIISTISIIEGFITFVAIGFATVSGVFCF